MSLVSSSISFDSGTSSSNHMTATTQGSTSSSFDSGSKDNNSKHSGRKRSRRTKRRTKNDDDDCDDPIGASMTRLLNQNPNFDFQPSNDLVAGRKRGRQEKSSHHNFDWEDSSLETFWPLFGPQNRYRLQILSKCAWMIISNVRPHRDIPQMLYELQKFLFQQQDKHNNSDSIQLEIKPFSPNQRFRWTVSILILLVNIFLAAGVAFTSVYAWKFVTVLCFFSSSLFVDWKEIASLCPSWFLVGLGHLGRFLLFVDRVLLLGNRWRGREWNKTEFDFTDSMNLFPSNRPQSAARDQYLWRLPPPDALIRSAKQIPTNDAVTPRYSNTTTTSDSTNFDQREPNNNSNDRWSEGTRQHIEAIDFCYIMLREEFIQKQYSKLKRMKSSLDDSEKSISDHDDIRQRASTVSSMESFRQEFVLDPSANNIHEDELDQATGISTKLQQMLKNSVSFDDTESNVMVDAVPNTATLDDQKADNSEEKKDNNESVGSGSDGTATDMNWMDVGTEIGMKLLGSSNVQKAIVADHTYEKIGMLKDKMDNHFKTNSTDALGHASGQTSSSRPGTPFFDAGDGRDDFNSPTTERPTINMDDSQRNESAVGYALPVHPMWTSAAAAVSPSHSFATTATLGTKDDSILGSPAGTPSPMKKSFEQSFESTTPIMEAIEVVESAEIGSPEMAALPQIDIISVSPTPRNSNKKPKSKIIELAKLPNIPATLKKKDRKKKSKTIDPAIELVHNEDEDRKQLIPQLAPPSAKSRIPMLLPGVKIAVPLFPITPDYPSRRRSRKNRKERYQMATVVSCKRICVYEKNNMPQSGNRGTNCLSITVNLDKSFLRNGQFATMTLRIMDRWGPKYMPKHSKLPMGSCVATTFGLGVLVGWRVEDDMHIVRSLWQRRGSGSACAYLRRDSIHATVEAAVGFEAKTTRGEGTVVGYIDGGPDFKCGRYLVDIKEEGSNKKQLMELIRSDVLSCESAKFIPIVEHIRAAAQYQLQIDRYQELHEVRTGDVEVRLFGEFSKHFDILWSSFLKAIDENQDFDDGMNKFVQKCVSFLDQLDAPTPIAKNQNDSFDGSIVIHSIDRTMSQDIDSVATPKEEEKPDSGFWLMNNMFDIFSATKDDSTVDEEEPVAEGTEIQFTPRYQRRSEKAYARAYAIIRTLTRTVTNAKAASADEPSFKIILNVCHEILLFVKTVIMVQEKNMNYESLEIWRGAWREVVSVFGPLQKRVQKIVEGIAERMEKHGRKAKARLLRFVDIIVHDETLFTALEEADWNRCAQQFEVAIVQAKIIDEKVREHYRKTAQFIYKHFSSATSTSQDAAARNNQKVDGLLKVIQVFANPRKAILELFLQESMLEMMERIFVRAFAKDEVASQMLNIHCSNFQSLRRFRMLKDFTIAGKIWIPLLDAADEEFSWAVSKLPSNAQEYLSPISSLFSLCVVQFHQMDEGDLTKDWLNFLMEEEAADIIHALDMKLILALEQFSRDVKDTMVVLPYYPSIDVDILNLVDELNVDEFVKEASSALDDEGKLREFIKEKATIMVERFLDYLPKIAIPVEKRDLGEGWTLTCRGAGGGDLTLSELVIKREHLICQVLGGDALFFPSSLADLEELDTPPTLADGATRYVRSPTSNPSSPFKIIEETSILNVIKEILTNAKNEGCSPEDGGLANDKYAASVLGNLRVSAMLNCAIDLWRDLEIDDDELLEVAIRDVAYQIEAKDKQENPEHEIIFSTSSVGFSSSDLSKSPKHRFNPRVDPTVLFLEIQKLTFNLENFLFRIEKHEQKRTIFDPVFEGKGSILVKNVLIKLRVQCFKGYCAKQVGRKTKQVPYPSLQLVDLDVSLEQVHLLVKETGADWLLNKIVDGFGDKFSEIISANLCEQVRKQVEEALGNLNGYFEENPEVLLGVLDISLDDLDELTVFV